MTREELEHVIRASARITNQCELVILGSQSILGAMPHPPAIFTVSAEADVYPLHAPELADEIDGAIGEGSEFHATNGFHAQGVGPDTAVLPGGGWSACVASRTRTPICEWACASASSTCSSRRLGRGGTRIASSASNCCGMRSWTSARPWPSFPGCPSTRRSSRRWFVASAAGRDRQKPEKGQEARAPFAPLPRYPERNDSGA